jgi:hypothetical protein
MQLRNVKQNRQLWAIVNSLKIDKEQVEELVLQVSNGRTKSTRELDIMEFQSLVNHLNAIKAGATKAPVTKEVSKADKMRKKILSICHEMNWKKNQKLDWIRINDFLNKSGYLHKGLNEYAESELPKLVTQFEQLLKSYYAKR